MKKCKKCGLSSFKKNGKRNGKQRLKCKSCGHVFEISGTRKNKKIDGNILADKYMLHNSTYERLSGEFEVSKKTIQRELDKVVTKKKISDHMKQL